MVFQSFFGPVMDFGHFVGPERRRFGRSTSALGYRFRKRPMPETVDSENGRFRKRAIPKTSDSGNDRFPKTSESGNDRVRNGPSFQLKFSFVMRISPDRFVLFVTSRASQPNRYIPTVTSCRCIPPLHPTVTFCRYTPPFASGRHITTATL